MQRVNGTPSRPPALPQHCPTTRLGCVPPGAASTRQPMTEHSEMRATKRMSRRMPYLGLGYNCPRPHRLPRYSLVAGKRARHIHLEKNKISEPLSLRRSSNLASLPLLHGLQGTCGCRPPIAHPAMQPECIFSCSGGKGSTLSPNKTVCVDKRHQEGSARHSHRHSEAHTAMPVHVPVGSGEECGQQTCDVRTLETGSQHCNKT